MVIIEDKAQKQGFHELKNRYFTDHDIEVRRYPLPVGDYILVNERVQDVLDRKSARGIEPGKMDFLGTYDTVVDSKYSMSELYQDCVSDHARFRDELILGQNNGIKLIILVENEDGIRSLDEVRTWKNPRVERWYKIWNAHKQGKAQKVKIPKQPPMSTAALTKALMTMESKYGCEFQFCSPKDAGERIVEILTDGE